MLLFLIFLLFPWLLDIGLGTYFLATVWGSLFWGIGALSLYARIEARDQRFRKGLGVLALASSIVLMSLWILGMSRGSFIPLNQGRSEILLRLTVIHATWLAAGAGMVVAFVMFSCLGLWKGRMMESHRVGEDRWVAYVPSLESVDRGLRIAQRFSLVFWSIGVLLSVVTVYLVGEKWNSFDLRIGLALVMWVLLLGAQWMTHQLELNLRQRNWLLIVVGVSFLGLFVMILLGFGGTPYKTQWGL